MSSQFNDCSEIFLCIDILKRLKFASRCGSFFIALLVYSQFLKFSFSVFLKLTIGELRFFVVLERIVELISYFNSFSLTFACP